MPEEHGEERIDGASETDQAAGIPWGMVIRGNGGAPPRARVRAYLWAAALEPPLTEARLQVGAEPSA